MTISYCNTKKLMEIIMIIRFMVVTIERTMMLRTTGINGEEKPEHEHESSLSIVVGRSKESSSNYVSTHLSYPIFEEAYSCRLKRRKNIKRTNQNAMKGADRA